MIRDDTAAQALETARDPLALLIRLHDREADAELIKGLRDIQPGAFFAAFLHEDRADVAIAMDAALAALPDPLDCASADALAAEYADVYLTHGYRLAPTGSVWLTEDHLERQEPMFEVRKWFDHYGFRVPNWRLRSDDHIVHELQFIEALLALGTRSATCDAARFIDHHVLPWVPQFCALLAERSQQPLMAATASLTGAYLEALRDLLEDITGEARWKPEEKIQPYSLRELEADMQDAFVPGVAESW